MLEALGSGYSPYIIAAGGAAASIAIMIFGGTKRELKTLKRAEIASAVVVIAVAALAIWLASGEMELLGLTFDRSRLAIAICMVYVVARGVYYLYLSRVWEDEKEYFAARWSRYLAGGAIALVAWLLYAGGSSGSRSLRWLKYLF